jgi:alanine dehydrogenase
VSIRILSKQDISALADPLQDMEAVSGAFRAIGGSEATYVPRTYAEDPAGQWRFSFMPGDIEILGSFGLKVQSTMRPSTSGGPVISGCVLLYNKASGELAAILDSVSITALRTAAASGLATQRLANDGSNNLAMIGSGVQARAHLPVMCAVCNISTVRVWSRDLSHAEELVQEIRAHYGLDARAYPSVHAATDGADVICTASRATTPLIDIADVAPGAHINSVGAHGRQNRELGTTLVTASKVYVDLIDPVQHESGDIAVPVDSGAIGWSHVRGDLGGLLLGTAVGRESPEDITLYKGSGVGVSDVALARSLCDRAEMYNLGTVVGG